RSRKLNNTRHLKPAALAVDLQTNAWYEHNHEQYQAEDVKRRREIEQFAVIGKRDREHCNQTDRESDQLFDPIRLGWLRVANLDRAKQDDGDRQECENPV